MSAGRIVPFGCIPTSPSSRSGGGDGGGGILVGNLSLGPALEFERSDATRKLRLVLAEMIAIMGQV